MIRWIRNYFARRREQKQLIKELDELLYSAYMASTKAQLGIENAPRKKRGR